MKKIKMDCVWGFLKTVKPYSFSKLISVVCNFNCVCSTDIFLSKSFGLCCLEVISELTLSCIVKRGEQMVKRHKMNCTAMTQSL